MSIEHNQIAHLVKSETYEPPMYKVTFQDEGQPSPFESIAEVKPDDKTVMKNAAKDGVKRGVMYSIIRSVSGLFGRAIGGTGGSIASSAAHSAGSAAASNRSSNSQADTLKVKLTEDRKKELVCEAFEKMQHQYELDEGSNKYQFKQA